MSINPWRYRAVDAIVTRFNIYSAFAHGQHGLGETVYTDDHASYKGISYPHKAVKHSVSEYVKDQAHTNGIESFWATLKRGYHGTYHHVSEKHLSRYVAEFEGRHNSRPADTVKQIVSIVPGDGRQAPTVSGPSSLAGRPLNRLDQSLNDILERSVNLGIGRGRAANGPLVF